MKKFTKLFALILALAAALTLSACSEDGPKATPKATESDSDSLLNSYLHYLTNEDESDEYDTYDETEETEPVARGAYSSDGVTLFAPSESVKGKIRTLVGNNGMAQYMLTDDNTLIGLDGYSWDEDCDMQQVLQMGKSLAYIDSHHTLHFSENQRDYRASGIQGQPVYGFVGMMSGNLSIFSMENGTLYYSEVDKESDLTERFNVPAKVKVGDVDYTHFDEFCVSNASNVIYARSGDTWLYGELNNIMFFDGPVFFMKELTVDAPIEILAPGEYSYSCSPLYAKQTDSANLYFQKGDGERTIALPQGYTTQDLEQVLFDETMVIRFTDGAVYTGEVELDGTELVKHEALSQMGDHIRELFFVRYVHGFNISYGYENGVGLYILADDGLLYKTAENQ